MRVIAVYNLKGGVGKTASAVNLSYLSAVHGARTLLWDLDPQGAATYYLRVEHRLPGGMKKLVRGKRPVRKLLRGSDYEGLDLLPSDFSNRNIDLALDATGKPHKRLARILKPLASSYDHVYIDCSPTISLVSEGIFHAADALLVPTIPTTLSLRTLEQLGDHLERAGHNGLRVLPFFCMVDKRRALHREVVAQAAGARYPFLQASIPNASVVERMGQHRAPVPVYAPRSAAAEAYEALWREMMQRTDSLLGRIVPSVLRRVPFF